MFRSIAALEARRALRPGGGPAAQARRRPGFELTRITAAAADHRGEPVMMTPPGELTERRALPGVAAALDRRSALAAAVDAYITAAERIGAVRGGGLVFQGVGGVSDGGFAARSEDGRRFIAMRVAIGADPVLRPATGFDAPPLLRLGLVDGVLFDRLSLAAVMASRGWRRDHHRLRRALASALIEGLHRLADHVGA